MEIQFKDVYLEKLYAGIPVSGKPRYNEDVIEKFKKKVIILQNADSTAELKQFKSLNFEALKGDKKGYFSIRVDLKYRLEFEIEKEKITLREIIIVDKLSNHYR